MSEETTQQEDNIFKLENSQFELSLRIDGFSDEKEMFKFIKCCEKMIRQSQEYRLWVNYIVEVLGQDKCEFTNENIHECSIEVHHHPVCLFTIVQTIINDCISKGEKFSTFDISRKVIELHFQNKVGYVTLLSNLHEKYHNGFLQIPIEFVRGDYKHILTNYKIEDEEYKRILSLCSVHKDDIIQNWSKNNYPGISSSKETINLDSQIESTIANTDEPDITTMLKTLDFN